MSQDTMDAEEDGIAIGIKLGATRERRRIRRALKPVMEGLRREHRLIAVDAVDAATRSATRGKR